MLTEEDERGYPDTKAHIENLLNELSNVAVAYQTELFGIGSDAECKFVAKVWELRAIIPTLGVQNLGKNYTSVLNFYRSLGEFEWVLQGARKNNQNEWEYNLVALFEDRLRGAKEDGNPLFISQFQNQALRRIASGGDF